MASPLTLIFNDEYCDKYDVDKSAIKSLSDLGAYLEKMANDGYAGYQLSTGKTVSTNGATGIGFWYATPKDQKGTIALCVQGSVAKKLVQLSATNGLWQYYYLPASFNNSTMSNIEIYINGNEQGKVTTPSSGTIYIADLAVTI